MPCFVPVVPKPLCSSGLTALRTYLGLVCGYLGLIVGSYAAKPCLALGQSALDVFRAKVFRLDLLEPVDWY